MTTPKTDPLYPLYAWGTVGLGVVAIASLVVGANEIREFNNSCLDAEILLPKCYSDNLKRLPGQNSEGAKQ